MKEGISKQTRSRKNERGAALVMALMISSLLLVASVGLLMETSKNTINVTDGISDQQAYNAAESGIQSAVHILRSQKNTVAGCGDVVANPLINSSLPATVPANQINYRKPLALGTSDTTGDTSGIPRLSRWVGYNATDVNGRVPIDATGPTKPPAAGDAYSLNVIDPDNTGSFISTTVTGRLYDYDPGDNTKKTYYYIDPVSGAVTGQLQIKYTPPPTLSMYNVGSLGLPSPYFGTFTVSRPLGSGAIIPANNRFEIVVHMTYPYDVTKTIRGWIRTTSAQRSEERRV